MNFSSLQHKHHLPQNPKTRAISQTTMARSQEQEDHQKQYKHLQDDWNSFKASNSNHSSRRRRRLATCKPADEILQLMDISPRTLISSLQQSHSPSDGWKVRTNDLAIEEIVRERQAMINSGKLKGRRLFGRSESRGDLGLHGMEEICSACSSVLIQRSEVQSLCSSYEAEDKDSSAGDCSCSCSSFCGENMKELINVEKEGGDEGVEECGKVEKWTDRMAWFVLVIVVFALGLILSWRSLDGKEDDKLVPT